MINKIIKPGDSNFNMVPAQEVLKFHENDDVDHDRSSHHHTLGTGPNQAAAGNHKHGSDDIINLVINPFNPAVLSGSARLSRENRVVWLNGHFTNLVATGIGTALMVIPAIHLPSSPLYITVQGYDGATGNPVPLYNPPGDNGIYFGVARAIGNGTHFNLTWIVPS